MIAASSRYVRRLVTRQRFYLALAAWCLSQATILHLHNVFRQLTGESILDLRSDGYKEADVRQLLHDAGAQGRQQYTLISCVDLGVYMWSYAFLLSGLLSMASAVAPFEFFKYFNLLPYVAVLFDATENALILSMLLTYPALVDAVAPVVPIVSQWKWNMLYVCACLVAGSGLFCVAVAAGLAGKQRRSKGSKDRASSSASDAPQQQPAQKQQERRAKRA